MIPPLGNQFIVSLKDTSLFIVIGVGELTRQGQEIMAANFRAVEIWSAVAILYLIMTGTLTLILRATEKRMRMLRSEAHTSELQSLMRISYAVFCLKNTKHTYSTQSH